MRPIPSKDRRWLGWVACALSAALGLGLWLFWVLPNRDSVAAAAPVPSGTSVSLRLEEGQRVGVWASGRAAILGTLDCSVRSGEGEAPAVQRTRELNWNDTLWWATPRTGFESYAGFAAGQPGDYVVSCRDSVGVYEAEVLFAKDPSAPDGWGWVGVARRTSGSQASWPSGRWWPRCWRSCSPRSWRSRACARGRPPAAAGGPPRPDAAPGPGATSRAGTRRPSPA